MTKGPYYYRQGSIQPIEYIFANNFDYVEGNIIKYITRHKCTRNIEDLKKAAHYLEMFIEHLERERETKCDK